MTKTQVVKAMAALNIPGTVTGAGQNWEVEVPTELMMDIFVAKVAAVSGYKTGYGAWVLSPNYKVDPIDFNHVASRHHY